MAQLKKEFFERQFKNGDYSPLICLIIHEKSQKGKFSYEEIYNEIAEKFVTLKEFIKKIFTSLLSNVILPSKISFSLLPLMFIYLDFGIIFLSTNTDGLSKI